MEAVEMSNVLNRIHAAIHGAKADGPEPVEIWLGPKEQEEFREEIEAIWNGIGPIPVINLHADGIMRFSGLVVRFMAKDGLRIGRTVDVN